jgi:hypothetical protein
VGKIIRLTENELIGLIKNVLLEQQSLLGKTVNLFKDDNETQIFKTLKIKDISKKGDFIIIKEHSPKILRLKDSEKGASNQHKWELMKYDETIHNLKKISGEAKGNFDPIKHREDFLKSLEERDFEVIYYIDCNQKYTKNSMCTTIYDDPGNIDFSGFNISFRESGYWACYRNKKFIPLVINQFCKSGNKPQADYEP